MKAKATPSRIPTPALRIRLKGAPSKGDGRQKTSGGRRLSFAPFAIGRWGYGMSLSDHIVPSPRTGAPSVPAIDGVQHGRPGGDRPAAELLGSTGTHEGRRCSPGTTSDRGPMQKLLIANRGEIAVRIIRTAAEMGVATVVVHATDDARALPTRMADEVVALPGSGPAAYLDVEAVVGAAVRSGCDAVHPGYGFLSEHAGFARRCAEASLRFVGPSADNLELLGDRPGRGPSQPGAASPSCGPRGRDTLDAAMASWPGSDRTPRSWSRPWRRGGRGMRRCSPGRAGEDFERCASEALTLR